MRSAFDQRVLPPLVLELVRACQRRASCHLGGGAALSGAHLSHRLSADVDLFCHRREEVRTILQALPEIAREAGVAIRVVRDAGSFARAEVELSGATLELDLVHDAVDDLEPPTSLEGVSVESLADLRANKLTCILSRSEPRDLVDLLFLDRAGYPPEHDLGLALRKDAGIDPGTLAWLLGQFPVSPLPRMLLPLGEEELRRFRDHLRDRLRGASVPSE